MRNEQRDVVDEHLRSARAVLALVIASDATQELEANVFGDLMQAVDRSIATAQSAIAAAWTNIGDVGPVAG